MGYKEEPRKCNEPPEHTSSSMAKIAMACTLAVPVQYGIALQLSIFTPYVQLLGVSPSWTSIIWICSPISAMFVQPIIGHYSDRCASRFGRRRPFIVLGAVLICLAILLVAFAKDIGYALGDPLANGQKKRSTLLFILGIWFFDASNNVFLVSSRAFLADLAGDSEAKITLANAYHAFFQAVGNIIGFGNISYLKLSNLLPFTRTHACDVYCADLKTCLLLAIIFFTVTVTVVVTTVKENNVLKQSTFGQLSNKKQHNCNNSFVQGGGVGKEEVFFEHLKRSLKHLPQEMKNLLPVAALNFLGIAPFLVYSTDWMGKDVYGGHPYGDATKKGLYLSGVWAGSLGLMLSVMSMGIVSVFVEPLVRIVGRLHRFWGISNLVLAMCLILTAAVTKMANDFRAKRHALIKDHQSIPPTPEVKLYALILYAILGFPQAVTSIVPYTLTNIIASQYRAGQGLYLGILNFAAVTVQMFAVLVTAPLASLFGDSNLPAFFLGAIAAILSSISAFTFLEN